MCTTLVLAVPDFITIVVLEHNTLGSVLGAILMQEGHPLEFTSKQLCDRNLWKSTYDKEMMPILHAIETWCMYHIGRHYISGPSIIV